MQKAQNVKINRKIFLLIFSFIFLSCISQNKEIIQESDDYEILNKTLERFYFYKHKNDSIDLVDLKKIEKKLPMNKELKRSIKEAESEKENDTIYVKAIADKVLYKKFFDRKAQWRRERNLLEKYAKSLKIVFSPSEINYYQEQLKNNFYLWDTEMIDFNDKVIVDKKYDYTREESKKKGIVEKDKFGRVLIQRTNHYFTFSKPIYSKNHSVALIAYNYNSNFIMNVFEKINNEWVFKLVLSEYYFI